MCSNDHDVLKFIVAALVARRRAALVTVMRTWGSSPRLPGALLAIREDGAMMGSVSGGCVDAHIRNRYLEGMLNAQTPAVLSYCGASAEGQDLKLPCNGVLEVLYEPHPPLAALRRLLACFERREPATRIVDLDTGDVEIRARLTPDIAFDGRYFYCPHGPTRRLLIIGASDTSRYLAQFADALGYEMMVCDPRTEYADAWDIDKIAVQREMPDDVVRAHVDERTAVIALTHDPKLDDLALMEALISPAFYVGALGSHSSNTKRRARLRTLGLGDIAIARLHGPVGLAIGSRTPGEIAIAILAELTAQLRGADAKGALDVGRSTQTLTTLA